MRRLLLAILLGGCGSPHYSNGVRPGPRGEARVLLSAEGAGALPLACYDPLWTELRGPTDCADLVPPEAELVCDDGPTRVIDRGPSDQAGVPRLDLSRPATGWCRWPGVPLREVRPGVVAIDLDGDGTDERAQRGDGAARAWVVDGEQRHLIGTHRR